MITQYAQFLHDVHDAPYLKMIFLLADKRVVGDREVEALVGVHAVVGRRPVNVQHARIHNSFLTYTCMRSQIISLAAHPIPENGTQCKLHVQLHSMIQTVETVHVHVTRVTTNAATWCLQFLVVVVEQRDPRLGLERLPLDDLVRALHERAAHVRAVVEGVAVVVTIIHQPGLGLDQQRL